MTGEEQMQLDFKAELEEFKAQAQGVGKFRKIEAGKLTALEFTGKGVLITNKWGNEQYQLELTEKNDSGENRILAVSKNSPFARELMELFADGIFSIKVLRTGTTQTDTRYTIVKE
jgi:hypothetical protein